MRLLVRAVAWLPSGVLLAAVTVSAFAEAPRLNQDASNKAVLARANAALQAGEADQALVLLHSLSWPGAGEAEAHNLECRVLYTLEQWNRAVSECELAVKLDGGNSDDHLWLARALGEKASRASFLSAYSLAKRVRTEFEEAARLNPRNAEALSDLGEFYYSAPGAVGGGIDKAEKVAGQLDKVDAARAHALHGHIAEERKDYGTAEREYKQALAASAHPAFEWMTLASFYRRRERWPELESAVQSGVNAVQRDRSASGALYDGAAVLIRANRNPVLAAKMLADYLASPAKTEAAPAFVAHTRLARLKEQLGDREAAQRERTAALAMAHDYRPAQDTKH